MDSNRSLIGRIIKFVIRQRETEPKRLRLTKIIFSIIFLSALVTYIYYTIKKIQDESLSVKYSTRKNHLDMPTINITTPFKMDINCTYLYAEGLGAWNNQNKSSCNDRITWLNVNDDYYIYVNNYYIHTDNYYIYTFKPPSDKKFEIDVPGVRQINMIFTVQTLPAYINFPEIILMQFFDEELLRKQNYKAKTLQDHTKDLQNLINSTAYVNTYALNAYRHIRFSLTRIERSYLSRDWKSYLGFFPERTIIPLITTSKFLDYSMTPEQQSPYNTTILSIGLFALTNLVQQEKEVKDDTVGSWIGSIGGLIGLMLTVFTVLFGTKNLAPFGMIQKLCCISRTKRKFEGLSIIPLVRNTRLQDKDDILLEDQITYLTNRLHSLETVLTDYVISSDLIQSLVDETRRDV